MYHVPRLLGLYLRLITLQPNRLPLACATGDTNVPTTELDSATENEDNCPNHRTSEGGTAEDCYNQKCQLQSSITTKNGIRL
jgi:hypothetical protein